MYYVKVKEDYRWRTAQVAGREFTKDETPVPDEAMVDEVLRSPILTVRQETINATPAAVALAEAMEIDLKMVEGSGADGRVLKADVLQMVVKMEEGEEEGAE
jgi:pyruvate/2-oxoglutarate dehydrogenase complex dihydrolipoamide acyltransferase (E2) component